VCLAGNNKAYEDANNKNEADNEKTGHQVPFTSCSKEEIDLYAMQNAKSSRKIAGNRVDTPLALFSEKAPGLGN
jgi:hypothetical protein